MAVGRTLNVSESGLLVETSRELAPGLHLEIEIAVGDDLVEAKGLVVRCEGPRDDLYETGIQLVEMSSEDRGKLVRQS